MRYYILYSGKKGFIFREIQKKINILTIMTLIKERRQKLFSTLSFFLFILFILHTEKIKLENKMRAFF